MTVDPTAVGCVVGFLQKRPERGLGEDDVARLRLLVLDGIGCMLAGLGEDAVTATFGGTGGDLAQPDTGPLDEQLGPWKEPFVRGVALRYLDFLDVYASRDTCHPSEHLPVALHLAERAGVDGRDFLEALAVGYEAQARLADATNLRTGGFHHVTAAAVSVPLVAARLGAVPRSELGHAVSLAVAQGVVLRSVSRGAVSMAKAFAFPLAAKRAMECVGLAAQGVTGPAQALDDLLRLTGSDAERLCEAFCHDTAASAHLAAVQLKTFPVQYALQSVVECGVALHPALRGRVDELEAVRVVTSQQVLDNTTDEAKRHPATREAADHSLYSCLAMALTLGHVDAADFAGGWRSPDARRVADAVSVHARGDVDRGTDGDMHPLAASVSLDMRDGGTVRFDVPAPLGCLERPMTEAQVVEKFVRCAGPIVGDARCREVLDAVSALESSPSVRELGRLLRV